MKLIEILEPDVTFRHDFIWHCSLVHHLPVIVANISDTSDSIRNCYYSILMIQQQF